MGPAIGMDEGVDIMKREGITFICGPAGRVAESVEAGRGMCRSVFLGACPRYMQAHIEGTNMGPRASQLLEDIAGACISILSLKDV